MRTAIFLSFVCGLALAVPEAAARGRYIKGRTVFLRKCAPCLSVGWKWAPGSGDDWRKANLRQRARRWSTARVCTWMRKNAKRRRKGALCYPSRMTNREKLDALYYLKRRAQGAIRKPVLRRRTPKLYRGPKFRLRAAKRRAAALRQKRQMEALRKARRRYRRGSRFHWSRKRRRTRRPVRRRKGR